MSPLKSTTGLGSPATKIPPRKKRKPRPPIRAKITLEPGWRGDVGFVSEDVWKDLFGPVPRTSSNADNEEEELPEPPVYHIAISVPIPSPNPSAAADLTVKEGKWTVLPVTLPPAPTSQFPALPHSTILFPDNPQTFTCLSGFKASLATTHTGVLEGKEKKVVQVLVIDVDLVGLETLIIRVSVNAHEEGHIADYDVEEAVRRAVSSVKVLHRGDQLRLAGHPSVREGRVELCEPVDQGVILPSTKIVVLKEARVKKKAPISHDGVVLYGGRPEHRESEEVDGMEEEEDEDDEDEEGGGVTTFFNLPSLSGLGLTNPHTPLRNGLNAASVLSSPGRGKTSTSGSGKNFNVQPLAQKIPPELLHPRPKEGEEDEEARAYVEVSELVRLRTFSGDWVGLCLPPPLDISAPSVEAGLRSSDTRRKVSGGSLTAGPTNNSAPPIPEGWEWRPVRIYSLPDIYPNSSTHKERTKGKTPLHDKSSANAKPKVYLSPILLANLAGTHPSSLAPIPELHIFPMGISSSSSSSSSNGPSFPPPAKEVTLLRIASPTSTDRALQPSLLLGLKTHFESARRLVQKGDLIAVTVDEVLARSLFGEESGGVGEELLLGQNTLYTSIGPKKAGVAGSIGEGGKVVAWFKVGNISSAFADGSTPHSPPSEEDKKWGNVVYVDPASTRMVQAGTDKQKIPPTIYSTWEYYLDLRPPPLFSPSTKGFHFVSIPLRIPYRYVSATQRRLRELITAATSPRAIHLNLPPITILLTSTQRSIGKKTIAMRAAADVGVHLFHIDAYDIVAEGNNGDIKTEAFLRARVERALACGKENTVLLISHVEAFGSSGSGNQGGAAGKIVELLKELVSQWRVVVGTTSEVDKLGDSGGGGGGGQGGAGGAGGGIRGVFTHELEVTAPDEGQREGLLKGIVEEKGVTLGEDVQLSSVAVKTAALVAGDLVDVVERAASASRERVNKLAKRLASSAFSTFSEASTTTTPTGPPEPRKVQQTIRDLYIAGGDEVRAVLTKDFETAVEAARRNFADSIGAPKIPNVGWDDVGGLNNVKSAVLETIQLPLERPELFAKGMKKRSGILFYGPPGTGKTLLAKAIATEFSLNFFSVKGPELLNMYIGESEANVRRVFQRARDARPCVVFFDELDSVAPKRGNQGDSGGVMDRIVSQLLAELDGMSEGNEGSGGVFVVGATNRPDLLDAALLRPGRFDKLLYLGVSDTHDKQLTILEALTRKFTLSPNLSLRKVAETLPFTYTGADLYALCSDAMLKAITRQAQRVESKVRETSLRLGKEVSTGWWFDHESGEDDVRVIVEYEDFDEARKELVGSVSQKELEHYERVRGQFELSDKDKEKVERGGQSNELASSSRNTHQHPQPNPNPYANQYPQPHPHQNQNQSQNQSQNQRYPPALTLNPHPNPHTATLPILTLKPKPQPPPPNYYTHPNEKSKGKGKAPSYPNPQPQPQTSYHNTSPPPPPAGSIQAGTGAGVVPMPLPGGGGLTTTTTAATPSADLLTLWKEKDAERDESIPEDEDEDDDNGIISHNTTNTTQNKEEDEEEQEHPKPKPLTRTTSGLDTIEEERESEGVRTPVVPVVGSRGGKGDEEAVASIEDSSSETKFVETNDDEEELYGEGEGDDGAVPETSTTTATARAEVPTSSAESDAPGDIDPSVETGIETEK